MSGMDREQVKAAVAAQAWDEGQLCTACNGLGRMPSGGPRFVHCIAQFTGADWPLDRVLDAIDSATWIRWEPNGGHDLAVTDPDGLTWRFDVQRPDGDENPGGAR